MSTRNGSVGRFLVFFSTTLEPNIRKVVAMRTWHDTYVLLRILASPIASIPSSLSNLYIKVHSRNTLTC
jgi:hypothetical protein